MVVSLLAVTNPAIKRALPEVYPTQPAKLTPLRAAANNLSRCEGHCRALAVYRGLNSFQFELSYSMGAHLE